MTHRNLHAAENMNISKPAVVSLWGWLQNQCFIIWELFLYSGVFQIVKTVYFLC